MVLNIKYLGHSSFIFDFDNYRILTDPFFAKNNQINKKRLVSCSHSVKEIPKIDNILISHEHFDSFDIKNTNYVVKKHKPKILAHQSVLNKIDCHRLNKIPMDEFKSSVVNDIEYKAYPAHHPTSFYPLSYNIKTKKNSIFFAGDTFMTPDHKDIKADVAILPIGGKRTMDICGAVKVAKRIKPKYLIPMHYNTFKEIKQDPKVLHEKINKDRFKMKIAPLKPGEDLKIV